MRRFDDPDYAIHVEAEEAFIVALTGNPTTGYTWHLQIDPNYLELLQRQFEPATGAIGAGGRELFYFHAQHAGKTWISFEYRRPWSGEARAHQQIQVLIV